MQQKKIHYATIIAMLLGVILSLFQFLYNRSIWLDEAMLSLNIISRSYTELLKPLDSMQVAPIGFLLIEKFFSTLIPNSEYGLRIFPLLCFWSSIYLFYKITTILLKDSATILLAVLLFCLNTSLVYYSSEVKQYIVDVFISLLLYYTLLKEYKNNITQYILLALFGALGILLSNTSIIILFTISVFLIATQLKKQKINLSIAIPFITWVIVFCFYYYRFIHNHPSKNGMLTYWGNSFMPLNIFELRFWDFCFYKTKMVFGSLLSFGVLGLLPFLFFIISLHQLIKRKQKKLLVLLLLPTVLQLALSAFKLYPFDLRLILYQTGFYIIIITIGVMQVLELDILKQQQKLRACIFLLLPLITGVELLRNYPLKTEELKSSINFIQLHAQPSDTIYVYYGAIPAFNYYQKIGGITFKNPIIFGHAYRGSNQKYVDEIKNNKGKFWVLFSHIYDDESKYIVTSLNAAYKKVLNYKTNDSEVYLYESLYK